MCLVLASIFGACGMLLGIFQEGADVQRSVEVCDGQKDCSEQEERSNSFEDVEERSVYHGWACQSVLMDLVFTWARSGHEKGKYYRMMGQLKTVHYPPDFGKNARLKSGDCPFRFRKEHKAEAWIMAPKPNLSRLAEYFNRSDLDRALYSRAAIGTADRFRADFVADFAIHASLSAVTYKQGVALQEWGTGLRSYNGDTRAF